MPVRFAHIAHPPGLVAAAAQLAAATGPPRLRVRLRADGGPIGGSAYYLYGGECCSAGLVLSSSPFCGGLQSPTRCGRGADFRTQYLCTAIFLLCAPHRPQRPIPGSHFPQ